MLNRAAVVFFLFLSSVFSLPTVSLARDIIKGPLIISLSEKWNVNEEPGPELLKAALAESPTATLSVWKYNPGRSMSASQFMDGLRGDLGWTPISSEMIKDPRFGQTNAGLYRKSGAYEELQFKIRSYDFVLSGDIYVLEMRSPQAQFDGVDREFQEVFRTLSNLSGAPAVNEPMPEPPRNYEPMRTDIGQASDEKPYQAAEPPPPVVLNENPPEQPMVALYYELPDRMRIGFDANRREAWLFGPDGTVRGNYAISGTPLIRVDGVYFLSGEYAYRIDPINGNVIGRAPIHEVEEKPADVAQVPVKQTEGGDPVKLAVERATGIRRSKGVKAAIEYLMAERPQAEKSRSPHLYEFFFRLGEYWEETGDLETALAYYRLATRAID